MANGLSGEWNLSLQPVLKGQALPRNLVVPPTTLKAGVRRCGNHLSAQRAAAAIPTRAEAEAKLVTCAQLLSEAGS